jgi:signal transduction histidine kinase
VREAATQLSLNSDRWSSFGKKLLVVLALLLPVLLAGASLRGRPSYALTAFGDLTQFFLLATATLFFFGKGIRSRGTARAFWFLIALGFGMWSVNMFLWVYCEVWLNRPLPSLPVGAFLLFVKLVPMLAALALGPSDESPGRPRLLSFFDLSSLLACWTYVYLFWALAYLLVGNDLANYNRHSDVVNAVGNQIFLLILAVVAFRSRAPWRAFFFNFLGATATYSFASSLINHAISLGHYYTGGIYDVPLTASMAWFCVASIVYTVDPSLKSQSAEVAKREDRRSRKTVIWPGRLAMLATLSTPMIGLWLLMNGDLHNPVRHFRILLTLFTTLLLTILLLLKQEVLNFELAGFLRDASLAYSNLKRFEHQLVQNEKLASLGKLVARVAHEINRAMSSVAKDVEALSSRSAVDANCQKMIVKIDESARRTNGLVESMLSFAQEKPLHRSFLDVRPLLESAMNLARAQRQQNVRVVVHEQDAVPQIEGDANQLIQVFLHIIANATDAMEGNKTGLLTIDIRTAGQNVEIGFADTGLGLKDPRRVFEPFYTTKAVGKGVGLGLSTCYGIIRQHDGEIECYNRPEGGAVFRLVLRAAIAETVEVTT